MKNYFITVALLIGITIAGQVGIGTHNPNSESVLHLVSTDQRNTLLLPKLLTSEEPTGLIADLQGSIYYNTTEKCVAFFNETTSTWKCIFTPIAQKIFVRATNSANIALSSGLGTIIYDVEESDTQDVISNGVFMAPHNGIYIITASVQSNFNLSNSSENFGINILRNGLVIEKIAYNHTNETGPISRQINTVIRLNTGDTASIQILTPTNWSTFTTDSTRSELSIIEIK